ncbi:hypothetical protein [Cognatitamlana onchidii]|uniref:hypothetical protein n=1 Tax=Cognatitamlana onchidii TaxID=2562860 RepID=UPI0010A5D730|nr:hypothetical protein [Algibacter onchidii]
MFSLVNKKKRFGFERHPRVIYFGRGLSVKQKAAMAHVFFHVLRADTSPNLKMYDYVYGQFQLIGFGIRSKYMETYEDSNIEDSFKLVKKLSLEQKKWFASALNGMLYEIGEKPSFKHIQNYLKVGEQTLNPFIK